MATTTNFGWTTPNDTDLVKDGAAAIRTLGSAIDTSMAELKGGTTGQILSKTSNTDMDFTWIANDQGDITGITATSPLTGGGTTGAITVGIQDGTTAQKGAVQLENSTSSTSTTTAAVPASVKSAYDLADGAIAKTTLTTAGDIVYRNATVPTRLALGTAGQVLTVNSGATAPQWATPASGGGMTSIASGSLSGSSLDLTSISSSYNNLQLVLRGLNTSNSCEITVRLNNISTSTYNGLNLVNNAGTSESVGGVAQDKFFITYYSTNTTTNGSVVFNIFDYTNTTSHKQVTSQLNYNRDTSTVNSCFLTGACRTNNAIDRITISPSAGTWSSGTYILYGVK